MIRSLLSIVALALLISSPTMAQSGCEPMRLGPPPETPATKYATSTATNGRFWFVGDAAARTLCSGTSLGCQAGAVHVYELVGGRLEFFQTLVPPDVTSGSNFGRSIDAVGDRLVVGAPRFRTPGPSRGAVFVYEFDGEQWVEAARIAAPPEIAEHLFGSEVVLHGQDLVVWPNHSRDVIYSYRFEGGAWTLLEAIRPDGEPVNWRYGHRMELSDDWLFVGANRDDSIVPAGGSVYIYSRRTDGRVEFVQKLAADSTAQLGHDVAYNGRSLLVGAIGYSDVHENQGAVFAYEFDGEQWVLVQQIVDSGARGNSGFGNRVSVDGATMVASSELQPTPHGIASAYHFEQGSDGVWREVRELIPTPPDHTRSFGSTLAVLGGFALVGSVDEPAPGPDGAVYLFDLSCGVCPADLDADGALTIFDFLAFFNMFDAGDAQADFDGDGELTIFDFLAYQTAFDAGCE